MSGSFSKPSKPPYTIQCNIEENWVHVIDGYGDLCFAGSMEHFEMATRYASEHELSAKYGTCMTCGHERHLHFSGDRQCECQWGGGLEGWCNCAIFVKRGEYDSN